MNADNTDTYYFDDLALYGSGGGGGGSFDDGLLTNGDFENGTEAWSGNALDVQTEGDNSFNFANVTTAGQPFDVNLSQVVAITQGETYTLKFEASSDGNRTMVAGIGLNEDPWDNDTETVNLTSTTQTFTLTLSSADFGGANSRVIFDMGADTGVVVIDNVSLFCVDCGSGGGGGGGTGDEERKVLTGDTGIVVATPGKLIAHINMGYVKLDKVEHLILDEADKMLDMGFLPDIEKIIKNMPKTRQTLMFSATMPITSTQSSSFD